MNLEDNRLTVYWKKNAAIAFGMIAVCLIICSTAPILLIYVKAFMLICLLSIATSIWSQQLQPTPSIITYVILAYFSTALIAVSLFYNKNFPTIYITSYIPILEDIIFIAGISLFAVSILLFSLYVLYCLITKKILTYLKLINVIALSTIIIWLLIWICFFCSYYQLQQIIKLVPIDIQFYYESLFWSGGHLLQFLYSQVVISLVLMLYYNLQGNRLRFNNLYVTLLYLNCFIAVNAVWGHILYNLVDYEFKEYFAKQLQYTLAIVPILLLSLMCYELLVSRFKI